MEAVVGQALDEVKQSLSSALERRLKGQFEALERREEWLNQREQELKAHEKHLQDYEKQLQAREQALKERVQATQRREPSPSAVIRCQQIVDNTSTVSSAALFNTPAQQQTPAQQHRSLFAQRVSEATPSQKEQEMPTRVSFTESSQKSEPMTQVAASNRSPLFPQPSQPVAQVAHTPSPLFPQPAQPVLPASQGPAQITTSHGSANAAPQQVPDGNPQAGPVSRESCGNATQLKSMFEQKVSSLKEEPVQKRKSWSAVQNQLTLPNGSDTAAFKAHDQGYKSRTSFDKPVREKRNLSDLLEKGP